MSILITFVCAVESKAAALTKLEKEMVETTAGRVAFVLTVVFELLPLVTPAFETRRFVLEPPVMC